MTIIQSAYDTTVMRHSNVSKIKQAVETAHAHFELKEISHGVSIVVGNGSAVSAAPVFNYPVLIKDSSGNDIAVFDARSLVTASPNEMEPYRIREPYKFDAYHIGAALSLQWAQGTVGRLRDMSQLPLAIYANWFGAMMSVRFGIDAGTQLKISILAAVFYLNQFCEGEPDEREKAFFVVAIQRACGYRVSDIQPVVDNHGFIQDIEHLCESIREYTQKVQLEDLNAATLVATAGGYWYYNHGREAIAVALEYPPLWLQIVFQSITDRGFKKARLTTIVERNTYRKFHQDFVRQMASLATPS